jgi:hypothetical protein
MPKNSGTKTKPESLAASDHARIEYTLEFKRGDDVIFDIKDSSGLPFIFNKEMLLSAEEKIVKALDDINETSKIMLVSLIRKEIDALMDASGDSSSAMQLPSSDSEQFFMENLDSDDKG